MKTLFSGLYRACPRRDHCLESGMHRLEDLDLMNGPVLVRVDFNVPLDEKGGIADDWRMRAALPTLEYLLKQNVACVLMTHLDRPGGKPVEGLRVKPLADHLKQLMPDATVFNCDEVVGKSVETTVSRLKPGEILLLENLRFDPGEKSADAGFARQLAGLGKVYVNDAFAACHRKHASVYEVPKQFVPGRRAVGRLVKRELDALEPIIDGPNQPFVQPFIAVFGGAKVSDKLAAVRALAKRADRILVGGAMAYTFTKAVGEEVGNSKVEEEHLNEARDILKVAGEKLMLPVDHRVKQSDGHVVTSTTIPYGATALDIGPETVSLFQQEIERASTVLWNGPMGKIEDENFFAGTRSIAESVARTGATTVVGGGETSEVVRRLDLQEKVTHLSTGGGAFLTYVAEGSLPALAILEGD